MAKENENIKLDKYFLENIHTKFKHILTMQFYGIFTKIPRTITIIILSYGTYGTHAEC